MSYELLMKSYELNPKDSQVLFNLAGIFTARKDYQLALEFVEKCLELSPNYQNAKILKSQIIRKLTK